MSSLDLFVQNMDAAAPPSGPPVLLVHGFCSRGSADWPAAQWARPLAQSGRDVIVVDLPAHGESPRPDEPMPASSAVAAVARVVAAAGGVVDVVGYSLGARLAWELASAQGITVRRLALGGLSALEPFTMVDLDAARAAIAGSETSLDPLTGMIVSMTQLPGNDPVALLNLVEGFATEPFDPSVNPPTVRTLLLGGTGDPMAQGIDELAAVLTDGRVVRVPGDHLAALHSPQLREAVLAFLD